MVEQAEELNDQAKRAQLAAVPVSSRRGRPFGPLCHWEYSDRCTDALNELHDRDPLGYGRFADLINRSEGPAGIEPLEKFEDLSVPVSFAPREVQDPPWLGCLKVDGDRVFKRSSKIVWLHRLYFGLPLEHQDLVVGVGAWSKNPARKLAPGQVTESQKQRRYIGETMKHLKWWFGKRGYTCEGYLA